MTEKEMIEIKHGSENMCDLLNQEQVELKKAMVDKEAKFSFIVIDNKTGKEADDYTIALKEDWARGLIYCDMEGFAILEDGTLVLLDECGNVAYCPSDRFSIIPEGAVVLTREENEKWLDFLELNMQKARKETAREIFSEVLDLEGVKMIRDMGWEKAYEIIYNEMLEIAKQFGVEVDNEKDK